MNNESGASRRAYGRLLAETSISRHGCMRRMSRHPEESARRISPDAA
ncbi:hypothetical protein [Anaerobium acetethylicum]|nr:hypothetical protein [Anaerobium acetethylicum]